MKLSNFFEDDEIKCEKCGWCWDEKDTEPHDKYVCHKCGHDNSENYDD
jgi:hypothetical protein